MFSFISNNVFYLVLDMTSRLEEALLSFERHSVSCTFSPAEVRITLKNVKVGPLGHAEVSQDIGKLH